MVSGPTSLALLGMVPTVGGAQLAEATYKSGLCSNPFSSFAVDGI